MGNYSPGFIVFMVASIILLFVIMGFSASGAGQAVDDKVCSGSGGKNANDCQKACHKDSKIVAITAAVAIVCTGAALVFYFVTNKKDISTTAGDLTSQFADFLAQKSQSLKSN